MSTSGSAAYEIDQDAKIIRHPEKGEFRVGRMAFKLLTFLHANKGKVFTAMELLEKVWEWPNCYYDDILVRETIYHLRKQVAPDVIDTVRYYGYGVGCSLDKTSPRNVKR